MPVSPKEIGKVRLRLIQAGYRGAEASPIFYGTRMAIAVGAFLLFATPILFRPNVAVGLGGSLLGYMLPGMCWRAWPRNASTRCSWRWPTRST